MHRALPFMAEPILACMSYQYVSHRMFFSYVFVPHSVPVTLGTNDNDLPSREFIVADVRSLYTDPPHDGTNWPSDRFLTSGTPSGFIASRMRTNRPAIVARGWYLQ